MACSPIQAVRNDGCYYRPVYTEFRYIQCSHVLTLKALLHVYKYYTIENQGRWKEAEELDVQVVETFKRVLDAEHPSTLTSMGNLTSTYRNQGRWKEAEELEVQVMETRKRVLGAEHPDTLTSMANSLWLRSRSPLTTSTLFPSSSTTPQLHSSNIGFLTPRANIQSMQTIYQSLDERRSQIRLVEILSNDGDEKVQCRLSILSLEDNPTFTALSYVWGDPKVTEDIMFNNELFPVTTNLGAALKYFKAHWCSNFPDQSPGLFRL
jgi:Tetratricopeptide repeat/Heterokaryon incompatibility protein (HET)